MTLMKTTLYASADDHNPFVERLRKMYEDWERKPSDKRAMWPTCNSHRIYQDQNGLGLELDYLPLITPPQFQGVELTLVTINGDYIDENGLMKAGTYRRGRTVAVATRSIQRYSDGRPSYTKLAIEVTGRTLRASVMLYNDILTGKREPTVAWESNNKQ